jgi:hypothetical protein
MMGSTVDHAEEDEHEDIEDNDLPSIGLFGVVV